MRALPAVLLASACFAAAVPDSSFNGQWNLTVPRDSRGRAWWLEVTGAGTPALAGKFIGAPGGQLDVIPRISIQNGELQFVFQRKYARWPAPASTERTGVYRARLRDDKLHGTLDVEGRPDLKLTWTGERAAEISDRDDGSWKPGKAVELINGRDLTGWHSRLPAQGVGWRVSAGLLNNGNAGVPDLVSAADFWNFSLHVEYRIGKGSNSGVGLRGRYEVQILDDYGEPPSPHGNGAIYSRVTPTANASRRPGEWQTLDIRLIGRMVTVVLNDRKVIDKQVIEGLTAMAAGANESRPGPLILQGDHGPVEFRKIVLTPLTR